MILYALDNKSSCAISAETNCKIKMSCVCSYTFAALWNMFSEILYGKYLLLNVAYEATVLLVVFI